MLNRKILTFSALCCLMGTHAFSQKSTMGGGGTDSKIGPSTGSNASIGNIFSPSLYNGTANINIPIYDFDAYGISLNYNTGGVKVSEISSIAGLHWNISAEGSIYRQVKDLPDEINSNVNIVYQLGGGVAGGGSDVYTTGLKGKFAQYMGTTPSPENTGRYVDGESDDFMFSVGGLSFTFNIGANGFIFTHPHKNVKIQLLINGLPVTQMPVQTNADASYKQNLSFIVTDAQGNKYIFEEGDVSIKPYSDGMRQNAGSPVTINYVSRWVIKKVIRSDGSEINYDYFENSSHMLGGILFNSYSGLEMLNNPVLVNSQRVDIGEDLFTSKRLAAIRYPNNVIASFIYRPQIRCDNLRDSILQEIKISSDEQCTRYVMKQEYAIALPVAGPSSPLTSPCVDMGSLNKEFYHRLMLTGIDRVNCDGTISEHYYTFGYDVQRLPSRSSGAQDFFGYYNGQTITANGGELNIPLHTPVTGTPATPYGVNKSENVLYAKAGLLTQVQNAYGGKLTMAYDANVLSNVLTGLPTDALFMGSLANDGLCIKKMTNSDDFYPGKTIQQVFTYSGGQRFLTGGYFHYPLWDGTANMMFCGSYVTPHQLVNGSNHGYSNVTIETKNESGIVLSKKEITYSNFKTGNNLSTRISGTKNYYEMPYTDKQYIKDWELGLPLIINEYDQSGFITTKTTNTYDTIPDYTSMVGKVENTKKLNVVKGNGDLLTIASENYRPYTGVSLLKSTTVRKYLSDATFINDVVTYEYDDHNNVLTTTTKNSLGESSYVRNVYNYAVSGPDVLFGGQAGVLYDMTANGIEKLVGTERWLKGTTNSPFSDQLMDASISKFSYDGNKILPKKAFILQSLDPLNYIAYTGLAVGNPGNPYGKILTAYNTTTTPANFQTTTEVTLVDAKGRTTETKNMDLNAYQSVIWDATGNIAASVQNARYQDVGFTSFESAIYNDPNIYTGNEVISNGRFTYLQKGLSALDPPMSGKVIYRLNATNYIKSPVLTTGKQYTITFWCKGVVPSITGAGLSGLPTDISDEWGDWKFYSATFTAGANSELSFASGTPTSVDEIRLFPVGATMNSSVFTPLFGVSSSTDATGRITYYEYDSFGRQNITRNQEKNILSKTEYLIGQ